MRFISLSAKVLALHRAKPSKRSLLLSFSLIAILTFIVFSSCRSVGASHELQTFHWQSPQQPPGATLKVATFNLAHGRGVSFHQTLVAGEEFHQNIANMAELLRREKPDIVALQEADAKSSWSGNFDHVGTLSIEGELPHFYSGEHAHSEFFNLQYGTALISRMPLSHKSSESFDKSFWDTKGFVVATAQIPSFDMEVDIVSVHLDFMSEETRHEQIMDMVRALKDRGRPLVIMGDLNCDWEEMGKSCVALLQKKLDVHPFNPSAQAPTYPSDEPKHRIDWILISSELRFKSYQTLPDQLSDHLGVIAEVTKRLTK